MEESHDLRTSTWKRNDVIDGIVEDIIEINILEDDDIVEGTASLLERSAFYVALTE